MLNGFVGKVLRLAVLIVSTALVAGCELSSAQSASAQIDRAWILTRNGVDVYDSKTGQVLKQIQLPGWLWVGASYGCPPALALGPRGEAIVSSNVVPTLWRIDPVTLAVSSHELALDADTDKDVGFSGLAYSAEQGVFFAMSGAHGSLWRIDPLFRRAQKIPLSMPLPQACGLALEPRTAQQRTSRFFRLCAGRAPRSWMINLAADQRSGHVVAQACG